MKLTLVYVYVLVYVHVNVHVDVFVYEDANVEDVDADVDVYVHVFVHVLECTCICTSDVYRSNVEARVCRILQGPRSWPRSYSELLADLLLPACLGDALFGKMATHPGLMPRKKPGTWSRYMGLSSSRGSCKLLHER